jgi:hypothetical protein
MFRELVFWNVEHVKFTPSSIIPEKSAVVRFAFTKSDPLSVNPPTIDVLNFKPDRVLELRLILGPTMKPFKNA